MDDEVTGRPDPAEMLAMLEAEQARTRQALEPDPVVIFGLWGTAWLVGFLGIWTAAGSAAPVRLAWPVASVLFVVCLTSAMVGTMVHVGRRTAGVRGVSSTVGAMYGWSWLLCFVTLTAVMTGARRNGLPDETAGLLWAVLAGLVVGALYLAGGALWQDRVQYGLGLWILVASAAGALAGYPTVYLVMATAGGGGFLFAAAWFAVRARGRRW